jgi:hypothetical protein
MILEEKNYSLQQIRETEKRNRRFKGFLLYSDIKTTKQQADQKWYSVEKAITEKELHPSIFRKIILLFAAAFLCFWWITLFRIVPIKLVSIFFAIPILPLIVYIIRDTFFNPGKNYLIRLDFSGIAVGDQFFMWNELQQTAILQLGYGRNERDYLVLIFNDGSYKKFCLDLFVSLWNFKNKIASYIEYFKNRIQCNQF